MQEGTTFIGAEREDRLSSASGRQHFNTVQGGAGFTMKQIKLKLNSPHFPWAPFKTLEAGLAPVTSYSYLCTPFLIESSPKLYKHQAPQNMALILFSGNISELGKFYRMNRKQ